MHGDKVLKTGGGTGELTAFLAEIVGKQMLAHLAQYNRSMKTGNDIKK